MNYKKKYKKALTKAESYYRNGQGSTRALICNIFPELAESEDEKIRKAILGLTYIDGIEPILNKCSITRQDIRAWLEKQGEHANFRNKIHIGDKVTRNEDGVLVNLSQLNRVAKKQGEQKPADTEKGANGNEREIPISVWSEEDENIKESIITGLEMLKDGASDQSLIALYNKRIDWLKSLKERYTWKPSEEQIEALKGVQEGIFRSRILESLYQDLKKLMEE